MARSRTSRTPAASTAARVRAAVSSARLASTAAAPSRSSTRRSRSISVELTVHHSAGSMSRRVAASPATAAACSSLARWTSGPTRVSTKVARWASSAAARNSDSSTARVARVEVNRRNWPGAKRPRSSTSETSSRSRAASSLIRDTATNAPTCWASRGSAIPEASPLLVLSRSAMVVL
ncbi:MAG TPA: hypothetical protein VHW42_02860 [Actinomycetes bacterium]|nr:hypothetical protein [Actinomycetes bacterium]